ncbi:MAG TPA: hypothetical protein PLX71_07760, partial [Phycicoccus sp.]|nr:hypothetical protein [Phycicoccus sp.]
MTATEDALALLRGVLSLMEPTRSQHLGAPETLAAVDVLTQAVDADSGTLAARHALGWWHELSAPSASEQERAEHRRNAEELLLPAYLAAPDSVPPRVRTRWESAASTADRRAAELYEGLNAGDGAVDPDEMVDAHRRVVALTPLNDSQRFGHLTNLGNALHTRFQRL